MTSTAASWAPPADAEPGPWQSRLGRQRPGLSGDGPAVGDREALLTSSRSSRASILATLRAEHHRRTPRRASGRPAAGPRSSRRPAAQAEHLGIVRLDGPFRGVGIGHGGSTHAVDLVGHDGHAEPVPHRAPPARPRPRRRRGRPARRHRDSRRPPLPAGRSRRPRGPERQVCLDEILSSTALASAPTAIRIGVSPPSAGPGIVRDDRRLLRRPRQR